jgi:hypothetical protein
MAITKVTTPVTGFESPVNIGLKIPVGTNFNLPTGVEGMIRNDTDEDSGGTDSTTAITFYNGTDWRYFNSTKSIVTIIVDFLVIAGGGGGGAAEYNSHATIGGGGAGGYRNSYNSETSGGQSTSETALELEPGIQYNVSVGAGGDGAAYQSNQSNPGSNSVFESITSIGGGGGASRNNDSTNKNGGSGGGGCYGRTKGTGTANQGFDGNGTGATGGAALYTVGGGGGAGSVGTLGNTQNSSSLSSGGTGLSSSITGSGVVRAEGGGGSTASSPISFPTLKQGSGGYGGNEVASGATLRRGSDGIVILRYPAGYTASSTLTYTDDPVSGSTDRIITITGIGTGTVTIA